MANDLLDDLIDDDYQEALATGHLKPKHRDKLERFTSNGYFAAIHVCKCDGCGSITRTLGGIFHKEIGDQGGSRAQNILLHHINIPLGQNYPVTYLASHTPICAGCVEAQGFSLDPETERRMLDV
jgi:hypothetical protein